MRPSKQLDKAIYALLQREGPLNLNSILTTLERPQSTIYDVLLRLQLLGFVEKEWIHTGKVGRPAVLYHIRPPSKGPNFYALLQEEFRQGRSCVSCVFNDPRDFQREYHLPCKHCIRYPKFRDHYRKEEED